jgi:hypothetical protein
VIIKIILGGFLAWSAYMFATSSAVVDSLLLFAATGTVPGTDAVLSPAGTFWALGGFLFAVIILAFSRELIGFARSTKSADSMSRVVTRPIGARVAIEPQYNDKAVVIAVKRPDAPHYLRVAYGRGLASGRWARRRLAPLLVQSWARAEEINRRLVISILKLSHEISKSAAPLSIKVRTSITRLFPRTPLF